MKFLFILALLISQSCGDGLQDPAKIVKTSYAIAANAEMILDAKDISGTCPGSVNWTDASGNGNDGVIECNAGGSIGASPARVTFDGSNTHVTTTINGNNVDMPSATWVVWVRPQAFSFAHIISIDNHAGAWNRALVVDDTPDVFGLFTGGAGHWDGPTGTANQWQFIVVEFSASDLTIQRNGTRSSFGAPTYNNTSLPLTIGSSGDRANDFFDGDIGWVGIYPRVLTAKEIKDTCLALVDRFSGGSCN